MISVTETAVLVRCRPLGNKKSHAAELVQNPSRASGRHLGGLPFLRAGPARATLPPTVPAPHTRAPARPATYTVLLARGENTRRNKGAYGPRSRPSSRERRLKSASDAAYDSRMPVGAPAVAGTKASFLFKQELAGVRRRADGAVDAQIEQGATSQKT